MREFQNIEYFLFYFRRWRDLFLEWFAGLRVEPILTGDLAANLHVIEVIAQATNTMDRGRALVAEIRDALAKMQARTAILERRSVLFLVGRTPGRLDGMVHNAGHKLGVKNAARMVRS